MATLATIFDWITAAKGSERAPRTRTPEEADPYEIPFFANEDLYVHVKHITNTRVARETDPAARSTCWRMIGSTFAVVLLLIGCLLPPMYNMMAGYRLEALRQERGRLDLDRAALELEESKLLSPARLEELAKLQRFVDPAPAKVVYLEGKQDSVLSASRTW